MAYTLQPLIQTLEKILHPDHHHLIFDHKKPQLETILNKATYLKQIIESSLPASSKQIESVENQIRITTEKAEDIIESDIVDQILSGSTVNHAAKEVDDHFISWWSFFFKDIASPELQQVIDELDSTIEKVIKIVGQMPVSSMSDALNIISFPSAAMIPGSSPVVGLDKDVIKLKARLEQQSNKVEVIPIVGMGGFGKTTLAQILYNDRRVIDHFDIRAWATVSQVYSLKAVLCNLLGCIAGMDNNNILLNEIHELGNKLYKSLFGRRYLIVLDDVWDANVWDYIKRFFPNSKNENGSRILLTTRELSVANYVNPDWNTPSFEHHKMHHLDEVESWSLMRMKVFGSENCPLELENIGKDIAKNCNGHPLTIQVISGVLKTSQRTTHFWKNMVYGIHSVVTENEEEFSKVLSLSYDHLPLHLRPCLLYIGCFLDEIRASTVLRLWMAEGFLKLTEGKTPEKVGKEYLKALVDRNLLVEKPKYGVQHKCFGLHDLLRSLCERKAMQDTFTDSSTMRRMFYPNHLYSHDFKYNLPPLTRSFVCIASKSWYNFPSSPGLVNAKLLRMLHITENGLFKQFPEDILKLVNLRYLALRCSSDLPAGLTRLWNLQTLIVVTPWPFLPEIATRCELWRLTELRHLELGIQTHIWAEFGMHDFILDKLVKLSYIDASNFTRRDFADKIPNVKKLGILWDTIRDYILDLSRMVNLEKVNFYDRTITRSFIHNINFPPSIKKLDFKGCALSWEFMTTIGSLPNLQVLRIWYCEISGCQWNPSDGEFQNLHSLHLSQLGLVHWNANETHYPKLRKLAIHWCLSLQEIPQDIGNNPSMEIIEVDELSSSAVASAIRIQKEQHDLGNYQLQVLILPQWF